MNLLYELSKENFEIDPRCVSSYRAVVSRILSGTNLRDEKDYDKPVIASRLFSDSNEESGLESDSQEIGIVNIHGAMTKYSGYCNTGTKEIAEQIDSFARDQKVGGIILDYDTPGGTSSSTAVLIEAIVQAKKMKPIVSTFDMLCSAGIKTAVFTDYIIASDLMAEVGSIGTMASWYDDEEQLKMEGLREIIITPPESSDKNASYYEAKAGNYQPYIDEVLSPLAQHFIEIVKSNRNINESIPGVLSGKVFFAKDAIATGLIDAIGNRDFAIQKINELNNARSLVSAVSK